MQINWGGAIIKPYIVDPNGLARQLSRSDYGATLRSNNMAFADDIKAVFKMLGEYSVYDSWCAYDVQVALAEKEIEIKELQDRVYELEGKLDQIYTIADYSKFQGKEQDPE